MSDDIHNNNNLKSMSDEYRSYVYEMFHSIDSRMKTLIEDSHSTKIQLTRTEKDVENLVSQMEKVSESLNRFELRVEEKLDKKFNDVYTRIKTLEDKVATNSSDIIGVQSFRENTATFGKMGWSVIMIVITSVLTFFAGLFFTKTGLK